MPYATSLSPMDILLLPMTSTLVVLFSHLMIVLCWNLMFIPCEFGALLILRNSASVQTELLRSQENWCFDYSYKLCESWMKLPSLSSTWKNFWIPNLFSRSCLLHIFSFYQVLSFSLTLMNFSLSSLDFFIDIIFYSLYLN